jgi:hypothetical protein
MGHQRQLAGSGGTILFWSLERNLCSTEKGSGSTFFSVFVSL